MTPENKLVVFKGKNIRRSIHNNEWHFSVIDVVAALTDSENSRRYWSDLKHKLLEEEGFSEVYEKIVQLKLEAPDGKMREGYSLFFLPFVMFHLSLKHKPLP